MAEFPTVIPDLFTHKELQHDGKYCLSLFDVRKGEKGEWTEIVIDDQFPCKPRSWWEQHAKPCFAKPVGNELWALLLEKAFAKFVGSYGALSGGNTSWAWQCLTGESNQISISRPRDGAELREWSKSVLNVEKQREEMEKGNRRACPFQYSPTDPKLDDEQLWTFLVESAVNNYLMSAAITAREGEEEHKRDDGLIEGHAYSLIEVRTAVDVKLVRLRNPWGNDQEWTGRWSDHDAAWAENPAVKDVVNPTDAPDGMFYMEWADFAKIFSDINVCPKKMPTVRGDFDTHYGKTTKKDPTKKRESKVALNSVPPPPPVCAPPQKPAPSAKEYEKKINLGRFTFLLEQVQPVIRPLMDQLLLERPPDPGTFLLKRLAQPGQQPPPAPATAYTIPGGPASTVKGDDCYSESMMSSAFRSFSGFFSFPNGCRAMAVFAWRLLCRLLEFHSIGEWLAFWIIPTKFEVF